MKGITKWYYNERGIRTFETQTRNTLDISCAIIKELSHLPIIVNQVMAQEMESCSFYVLCISCCRADGLMIEIPSNPDEALSDGFQSLNFDSFMELAKQLKKIAMAMGRSFG